MSDRSEKEHPCRGFRWVGQDFAHCDNCGRDLRDHDGLHVATVDNPFAPDAGAVIPFAEAMERNRLFAHYVTPEPSFPSAPLRWQPAADFGRTP